MSSATTSLSQAQVRELRARLLSERRRIQTEHETDVERERAIAPGEAGDVVDRAESDRERQELLSAAEDELARIGLIDEALSRLRAGIYGRCLADGEPIPFARLRVVPWACYCTEHQEQWEAEHCVTTTWSPAQVST